MEDFFKNLGILSNGMKHFSPKETYELCQKGAIIVDVREEYMNRFKIVDVDEIIFCPGSILEENYKDLPKDKHLIFLDAVGLRSKEAVLLLKNKGFKNIANMAGGMVEWERAGLPLKIDKSERLTGSCMCMLRKRDKKGEKKKA